jgi:glucose/arabinose dehydrogenase
MSDPAESVNQQEYPIGMKQNSAALRYLIPLLLLILLSLSVWGVLSRKYLSGVAPALSIPGMEAATDFAKGLPLSYPPEFEMSVFAAGLEGPRVIVFDPAGVMLVSLPAAGKVVALPDDDGDGRADRIVPVAEGLNRPHGLAFRCKEECRLYIAETDRVTVFGYDPQSRRAVNGRKLFALPGGGRHSTRTILFLPPPAQDKLLVSVGSSCDACEEDDWQRAKILLAEGEDGSPRTFASGLRNSVFMRLHPETGDIWATEMGRDFLGDDLPPDEINIIRAGYDYGWPYCYGNNLPDREFAPPAVGAVSCQGKTPSHIDIPAHSAPLGLDFFPSQGWPGKYQGSLLVALHGSWNRSVPVGYKISLFRFAANGAYLGQEDFITGWLTGDGASLGRPVDIRIMPDGVLYISDDKAGVIYRLAQRKRRDSPRPAGANGG